MPLYAQPNTDPANPRCDRVVEEGGVQRVEPGTPTAGADLTNRNGAPALPGGARHVSYVLVPANTPNLVPLSFRRLAG